MCLSLCYHSWNILVLVFCSFDHHKQELQHVPKWPNQVLRQTGRFHQSFLSNSSFLFSGCCILPADTCLSYMFDQRAAVPNTKTLCHWGSPDEKTDQAIAVDHRSRRFPVTTSADPCDYSGRSRHSWDVLIWLRVAFCLLQRLPHSVNSWKLPLLNNGP